MIKKPIEGLVELKTDRAVVQIYKGTVVRYIGPRVIDYFHGGAKPENIPELPKTDEDRLGWPNSELVTFPVFGPVADYQVKVNIHGQEIVCPMDQHGISRHLDWKLQPGTDDYSATFVQSHDGKTRIHNTRYPKKGNPEFLEWPFAFDLEKRVVATYEGDLVIELTLKNRSDLDMPYMFGFHPAFKNQGLFNSGSFIAQDASVVHLAKVIEASGMHNHELDRTGETLVGYRNRESRRGFLLSTDGFQNLALWSPSQDAGMFCIEPVTHFASKDRQYFLKPGTHNTLQPGQTSKYSIKVSPY